MNAVEMSEGICPDDDGGSFRLVADKPSVTLLNLSTVLRFRAHAADQAVSGTTPRFDNDDANALRVLLNECSAAAIAAQGEVMKLENAR